MDSPSHLQAIGGLLALVVLFMSVLKNRLNSEKSKSIGAPEPSGSWPVIGHLHLLRGRDPVARTLGAMADKYGPVFSLRLGNHRALVVSSWEIVKDCFTTNDRILATRPSIAVGKYLGYDNAVFALAPYGPYWRDVRKMAIAELLSSSPLEMLKHVRSSEVDSYIKDIHLLCVNNGPTEVAMDEWFEHLTFNISIRKIAGKRFSASTYHESNTEASRFEKAIKYALYLSGVFVLSDSIPYLEWMDFQGYVSSMKQTAKELDSIIQKWLEEHLQKRIESDRNGHDSDFMDAMLSTLAEDTIMSGHDRDTIVKATTLILVLTGSESTAVTLTWALSLLLNNRQVLKAAQEELDLVVGREKWVEESDTENLPYLRAIIKETLRLYPPSPLTGPREATENCYIGGHYVPKGTRLIVNIWKLQRDPRMWSDPCEFRPERFLTTHAEIDVRGRNFEYIPFSSGRRSCPGLVFGLQVVHLTLARLLQGFDMTTPSGMLVDMCEGSGTSMPKANPLKVVLTPRLPLELYQNL